jgi:hypothetical protein
MIEQDMVEEDMVVEDIVEEDMVVEDIVEEDIVEDLGNKVVRCKEYKVVETFSLMIGSFP